MSPKDSFASFLSLSGIEFCTTVTKDGMTTVYYSGKHATHAFKSRALFMHTFDGTGEYVNCSYVLLNKKGLVVNV